MDISNSILQAITDKQHLLKISETDLIKDIMNKTTWWRIRTHQSDLSLSHAIQLLGRVNLSFKVYEPEVTIVSSAKPIKE